MTGEILFAVIEPPLIAALLRWARCSRLTALLSWAFGGAWLAAIDVAQHQGAAAAVAAGHVVVVLAIWWWRERRDRVRQLLGAKSRALREALVRRVRELARPRPQLAPGGVS